MRVLGIDQSLSATGLAVIDGDAFEVLEVVKPKSTGHERLEQIAARCLELAATCDVVALEGPSLGVRRSAATGALFGLFGILSHDLWRMGRDPIVINPMHRALYAAGSGAAKKADVVTAAILLYGDARLTDDNIADAAVIAAMAARIVGAPIDGELPSRNLSALTKVPLPPSLEAMVMGQLRNDRAWQSVARRVDQPTLAALRALDSASPEYAHALVDFAAERGYRVYPNQGYAACVRRLDHPTHTCGAKKCATDWATPSSWVHRVLLKQIDGDGWAILTQQVSDHGLPAPLGGDLRVHLHTSALVPAGA